MDNVSDWAAVVVSVAALVISIRSASQITQHKALELRLQIREVADEITNKMDKLPYTIEEAAQSADRTRAAAGNRSSSVVALIRDQAVKDVEESYALKRSVSELLDGLREANIETLEVVLSSVKKMRQTVVDQEDYYLGLLADDEKVRDRIHQIHGKRPQ